MRQAGYPREVLAVAPKFAKPDSAAAARIQRENARSRQVSLASLAHPACGRAPSDYPETAGSQVPLARPGYSTVK